MTLTHLIRKNLGFIFWLCFLFCIAMPLTCAGRGRNDNGRSALPLLLADTGFEFFEKEESNVHDQWRLTAITPARANPTSAPPTRARAAASTTPSRFDDVMMYCLGAAERTS